MFLTINITGGMSSVWPYMVSSHTRLVDVDPAPAQAGKCKIFLILSLFGNPRLSECTVGYHGERARLSHDY